MAYDIFRGDLLVVFRATASQAKDKTEGRPDLRIVPSVDPPEMSDDAWLAISRLSKATYGCPNEFEESQSPKSP